MLVGPVAEPEVTWLVGSYYSLTCCSSKGTRDYPRYALWEPTAALTIILYCELALVKLADVICM